MANRPNIPNPIRRQVLVESGHRCAVCGSPSPLEIAHIVPWSVCKRHEEENLIALCASCHGRADREDWGRSTLRQYKKYPWVRHRGSAESSVYEAKREVEILIKMDLATFGSTQERMLRYSIAGFLEISPDEIEVVRKEEGSTIVTVAISSVQANRMSEAFWIQDFEFEASMRPFQVLDVQLGRMIETEPPAGPQIKRVERARRSLELIALLRSNLDRNSIFQELHSLYSGTIQRFFLVKGLASWIAEDLSQETFARVFRALDSFRGEASFDTYLFTSARNTWRNHLRSTRAQKRAGVEIPLDAVLEREQLEIRERREGIQEIDDAIDRLPKEIASVLELRLQGYTRRESAAILRLAETTIASRLRDARRLLAAMGDIGDAQP